jgi:hypothetical protein
MVVLLLLIACGGSCSDVAGCAGVSTCCQGDTCWYERDDGDRIDCDGTDCTDAANEARAEWCPP